MSHSFERQNVNSSDPADQNMSVDSHPPSRAGHRYLRLEQSTVLRQSAGARTRLQFEYGANMTFKVLYAALSLQSRSFSIDEQMANLYYARHIIQDAEEDIKDQQNLISQDNLILAVEELKARLESFQKDSEFQAQVRRRLAELQTERFPRHNLNDLNLEVWHSDACAFLKHTKPFAVDFGIANDVATARNTVGRVYQSNLKLVEDNSLFAEVRPRDTDEPIESERSGILQKYLALMGEPGENTQETVRARFIGLFRVYETLSLCMRDYETGSFSVLNLADALDSIKYELSYILGQDGSNKSLYDLYFDFPVYETLIEGCAHALTARSQGPVHHVLASKFQQLCQLTMDHPTMQSEKDFTDLAELAVSLAMSCPKNVEARKWEQYAPSPLKHAEYWNFMNKLQILYTSFQDKTYNSEERSKLWLAVWRGLKTVYLIVRKNNFKFESLDFPAEKAFFSRNTIRNQFEWVMSAPEPLYPIIVENIVAEYCLHLDSCRKSQNGNYPLVKLLQPTVVRDSIFDSISEFVGTKTWDDIAMRGIEKCAVRLNHILDGPAYARRVDRYRVDSFINSAADWIIQKATEEATQIPSVSQAPAASAQRPTSSADTTSRLPTGERHPEARPGVGVRRDHTGDSTSDRTQSGNDDHDDIMEGADGGMNIVSAFDYVAYPFPETRALEVAYSRQITREMSQSGIYSEGALVEDVTNRPPRHVWPPGKISIWSQSLPIGPISILKHLWRSRRGKPAVKLVKPARPYPSITPRRPRKEWADEHPRLRPLRDINNRVVKPTERGVQNHQTQYRRHSHIHVPKLRGGGPKLAPSTQQLNPTTPVVPVSIANNRLDSTEMNRRTHDLYDRMRGFWRNTELPPSNELRERFLEPNTWNVTVAADAARRVYDRGLASSNAITTEDHRPTDYSNSFPSTGARRRDALNLGAYSVPTYQGRRGGRLPPNPPSNSAPEPVLTRQLPSLDSLLAAHTARQQGQTAGITAASCNAQNIFSTNGLSDPFQIWEDSSVGSTPALVSANETSRPAENQEQQAQHDRQRAALPPRNLGDNSSNQENRSPAPDRHMVVPNSPTPDRQTQTSQNQLLPAGTSCDGPVCHPCPVYDSMVHHVCVGQQSRRQRTPSTSILSRTGLFHDFGIDQSTPTWTPLIPSSAYRPRPSAGDENPSPLFSNSSDPRQPLNSITPSALNSDLENELPLAPPTEVGGHNLRNRDFLSQQRQDRDVRSVHFDAIPTLVQHEHTPGSDRASRPNNDFQPNFTPYPAGVNISPHSTDTSSLTSPIAAAQALADAAAATASAALAAINAMSGNSANSAAVVSPTTTNNAGGHHSSIDRRSHTHTNRRNRQATRTRNTTDGPATRTRSSSASVDVVTPTPAPRRDRTRPTRGILRNRTGARTDAGRGDDGDGEYAPSPTRRR